MDLGFEILESNAEISRLINQAVSEKFNKKLKRNKKKITTGIKALVPSWILSQPEMQSIQAEGVSFSLASQFGIKSGTSASVVAAIANSVTESLQIELTEISNKTLSGGLVIYIQPANFSNLLSLSEGFVNTRSDSLHWLDWLLVQGDKTIVSGYDYSPSNEGRSGGGVMIGGGGWRVPPQFSGTITDNFVTRALSGRGDAIAKVIGGFLK